MQANPLISVSSSSTPCLHYVWLLSWWLAQVRQISVHEGSPRRLLRHINDLVYADGVLYANIW